MRLLVWFWLVVAVLGAGAQAAGDGASPPSEAPPLDYFLVVTGGELLEGAYPDSHTHFLTRTLRLLGCRCVGSLTVDDHREDILRALHFATNHAPVVLVTGGLGPTPNDITRETLAEFTGIPLREHPDALADLERRVGQYRDQLRVNLRRQCLVPERGGYLKNSSGTAAGLVFELDQPHAQGIGSWLIALPGPPRELQPMVRQELVPFLQARCGVRAFGHSLTMRFVGVGQSQIDQTLKEHVSLAPDVIVTSLFDGSRVDFTFALPGHTPQDLVRLRGLETNLIEHLNEFFYADDGASLEEVVARRLMAREARVVVAEVGTGGQLAAALGGLKDARRFLVGACAAASEEALAGLLNVSTAQREAAQPERIHALAEAGAKWGHSAWAVAVGGVETDSSGKRVVWMALRSPEGRSGTFTLPARDAGETSRAGLVTAVLDQLRRALP
jgi:nicotinamide-nucleotide amidase